MTRVTLVRHGQAQTGAQDEESYDNLSALGIEQARWLGEYLNGTGHGVRRILAGPMRRQQQTAEHVAAALALPVETDERLVEINYFALAASMQERHAAPMPNGRDEFLVHFPQVMAAWKAGEISCPDESFTDYESRVHDALTDAEDAGGTMLVTSGGIIGMAMRHILGLETDAFAHVLLQICNTSLHRYQIEAGERRLMTFNATPHLDTAGREASRTYI